MVSTKMFRKKMPWGMFEHPMFDERLAEIAAAWWAERMYIEEKRDAFKAALVKRLLEQKPKESVSPAVSVYSDYAPADALLAALRDVGIECRGCMFSSEGILPSKTGITLPERGELGAKEGYGAKAYRIDE